MKKNMEFISKILLVCFFINFTYGLADEKEGFSFLKERGNVKEYFSSNKDNRFLIKIHVWGDTSLSGVHYVPDNAALIDIVGLAGGPTGEFEKGFIRIIRNQMGKREGLLADSDFKIHGFDLLHKPEYRDLKLNNGDVVFLEIPPRTDHFMRTLIITSTIVSIITAGITIYLLSKSN